jgi:hypothetical protein
MHETIFRDQPCDMCENTNLIPEIGKYACLCDNVPEEVPAARPEHFN